MIHKAIAKPVRIRVKSCGEEHSTLDSLKHAFCVEDLVPLVKDGRLSRWLNQQGEKELAEYVEMIDADKVLASEKEYIDFVNLFFEKEIVDAKHKVVSKSDLLSYWFAQKNNYLQNYVSFVDSVINCSKELASKIYKIDRSIRTDAEWASILGIANEKKDNVIITPENNSTEPTHTLFSTTQNIIILEQ